MDPEFQKWLESSFYIEDKWNSNPNIIGKYFDVRGTIDTKLNYSLQELYKLWQEMDSQRKEDCILRL